MFFGQLYAELSCSSLTDFTKFYHCWRKTFIKSLKRCKISDMSRSDQFSQICHFCQPSNFRKMAPTQRIRILYFKILQALRSSQLNVINISFWHTATFYIKKYLE